MSTKGFQLVPYPLRTPVWTAGGGDNISLQTLPKTLLGRIAHLAGISFESTITPTFTTAPTTVGLNNIVSRLDIFDGMMLRFQGSFNALRFKEILENGNKILPDPDTNSGSTNAFYLGRYWSAGPQGFAGDPSDFLIPCAALENAELRMTFGALTSISADTTACTVTMRPVAWLALLDNEIRIPPAYSYVQYTPGAADFNIQGRCLHTSLAMFNSNAYDATTAGDFAGVTVDVGAGQLVPTIDVRILARAYHAQMLSGHINPVQGDTYAATDDNPKIVNSGTPTALVAADFLVNPVLWSMRGARISKLAALAESALRIRWNGTQSTSFLLNGRLESQPASVVSAIAARALGSLKLTDKAAKVKTLSKDPYNGPRPDFMPYAIKVG